MMQVFNYARGSRSIASTKEATVISHILLSLVLLCLCLMTEGREHTWLIPAVKWQNCLTQSSPEAVNTA